MAVESPGGNRPGMSIDLGNVQSWRKPQQIGNVGRARPLNLVLCDHIYRGCDPCDTLLFLRHGRYLNVHEFVKAATVRKTMPRMLDPFQFLLVAVADWMNQHQQHTIEYLREENRVSVVKFQSGPGINNLTHSA